MWEIQAHAEKRPGSSPGKVSKIYYTIDEIISDGFNPKAVWEVVAGKKKTHKNRKFIKIE